MLPKVTDERVLPHRICDSEVGQHVSSVVPRVLGRPFLQLRLTTRIRPGAWPPNHGVKVVVHPQEINHRESELNDGAERLPGWVSIQTHNF